MYRRRRAFSNKTPLGLIIVLALLAGSVPVHAQVEIVIISPELEDGLAEIEAIVDEQIYAAAAEVAHYADPLLEKPKIMRAFADAAAAAGVVGLQSMQIPADRNIRELAIGSTAAFTSFSFNPERVEDRLESLTEEDDIYLGAAANPLYFSLSGPLQPILPGLRGTVTGGYLDVDTDEATIRGGGASLWGDYRLIRPIPIGRIASFSGVSAVGGVSWLTNVITTEVTPGLITESFSVDPDGPGPIFSQDVTVEVEPEVAASLETSVYSFGSGVVTGVELLGFLVVSGGVAGELAIGSTSLNLAADDEIFLTGYLSNLVAEGGNARLIVSGGTEPVSPTTLQLSVFGALTWRVAPYRCSIPVTWRSVGGLSTGIAFGVTF